MSYSQLAINKLHQYREKFSDLEEIQTLYSIKGERLYDLMEGMDAANNAVKGLKSAAGYIRREIGARLKLRHVPEMIFKATDSIEYSANISRILNDLDKK